MVLDLKEIVNADGEMIKFSRTVPMQPISYMSEVYSFADDVSVVGHAKNLSGTVEVYASIKGTLIMPCARCTRDTAYNFSVPYTDSFENSQSTAGLEIELEDIITEAVLCDIPMRILCKKDCRGLCPKCGADLNEGDCGCPSEESNLIWEKLKNLNLKDEV